MRRKALIRSTALFLLASVLLIVPADFYAAPQPNIGVNGFFAVDKAQRGRTILAAVVLDIPAGYHVNSSRPLSKFAIPTTLRVESQDGIKIGIISYPRATVRHFSFSKDQLAVYEGKAVMRFSITIPANHEIGITELRAHVKFQSCNDEMCFPPQTRELTLPIAVVDTKDSVSRINAGIFGGSGGRRPVGTRRRGRTATRRQ